jgi:protein-S-isoprenylcysteine O-methyltransferase Ste14
MATASPELMKKSIAGLLQLAVAMGLFVFLPAGTWRYPQGWLFILGFVAWSLLITRHLAAHDPQLLEKRVAAGPAAETRPRQKIIQALASLAFAAIMVLPAFDHRFGWSRVPIALVALGNVLVALGFWIVFRVFRENSFTSAVIQTYAEQRVIDTGPYAHVRHPMYAGALVLLIGIPLALGSYWGLLTLVPFVVVLVVRLLDEEKVLVKELSGYAEYRQRTRFRLVPWVW